MDPSAAGTATQTCYRHPNRVTGVSCSSCGRPICPDCMTATSVGMRCPECAKQRTKVHNMRTMRSDPRVTMGIIIVCAAALLASGSLGFGSRGGGRLTADVALYFTALLWGSFGALLLTPDTFTVGASGAVFGLMGAAAVELRSRGINPFQTDIGMLIVFNLGLSFVLSGISIGGHTGRP